MNALVLVARACRHCGSDIVNHSSRAGQNQFCCAGCEFVFGVLETNGLEKYYELRDANPPSCPVPATEPTDDYLYYDDPAFIQTATKDSSRVRFFLEGMNCTACIWLLEKLPDVCEDAIAARVDLSNSTIEVTRRPGGSFARIAQTLNRFGYRPHALRDDETATELQTRERRRDIIRIGVTAALTGNIMIMTVSLYGGARGDMQSLFQWIAAGLAAPVLTYGAWPFYRSAFSSLAQHRLNLDVPIVVAILVGVLTSAFALASGGQDIYFDSLSMLVLLLLSSRFLLKSIQTRNVQSTNIEDELLMGTVRKEVPGGEWLDVSASSLRAGDRIILRTGSLVPIDGRIELGTATINAAVLTGESANLRLSQGDTIEAGCRLVSGDAVIRVDQPSRTTRLAAILKETERLAQTKSEFVHVADRAGQIFIAIVLCAAAGVVGYFLRDNPSEGVARALALVIVTCPCVFGMAIPLSMAMAIRNAARRGIIVKSADAIENLWSAKNIFFDKTATLTTGAMTVVRSSFATRADLGILLGLEQNQLHPVARCLTKFALDEGATPVHFDQVSRLEKGGVAGFLGGIRYEARPRMSYSVFYDELQKEDLVTSEFALFREGHAIAIFEIGDQVRVEAGPVLRRLRLDGFTTHMISGDRDHVVAHFAEKLGFSAAQSRARVTPEEKSRALLESGGRSIMVGDGANDAGAFAAASVGIAVAGSLDVSLRSADIYLTRPSLNAITEVIEIARATKRAIYRNLAFSASFNIIAGALAIFGFMTPLWAAVIMPLSSLTVLLSAVLSARTSKGESV